MRAQGLVLTVNQSIKQIDSREDTCGSGTNNPMRKEDREQDSISLSRRENGNSIRRDRNCGRYHLRACEVDGTDKRDLPSNVGPPSGE